MKMFLFAIALLPSVAYAAPVTACTMNQISLSLDGENGNFTGMSQGGTLLVLRNIGPNACSIAGFPQITLRDAAKVSLPIAREIPRGMHPGPVIIPAIIAAGAEVTATMHWVAGDVFDHSTCITPATLTLTLGSEEQTVPFGSQICGPTPRITYSMTRLNPDPVYTSKP